MLIFGVFIISVYATHYTIDPFLVMWTPAVVSNGLSFDGMSNYVTIPKNGEILDFNGAGGFTISAWVKYNQQDVDSSNWGERQIFINGNGGDWGFFFERHLNNYRFAIVDESPSEYGLVVETTGVTFDKDVWYYITAVYNLSDILIYVDGQLNNVQATDGSVNLRNSQDSNAYIGTNWGYGQYFNGTMDEIKIWNTSLSAGDISAIYSNESAGVEYLPDSGDVVGNWHFNENSGFVAHDSSNSIQDGTLTNYGFENLEQCFDFINNTGDSCTLGVDDYSETFSAPKNYTFLAGDTDELYIPYRNNVLLDFGGSQFDVSPYTNFIHINNIENVTLKNFICLNAYTCLYQAGFGSDDLHVSNAVLSAWGGYSLFVDSTALFNLYADNVTFNTPLVPYYVSNLVVNNSFFNNTYYMDSGLPYNITFENTIFEDSFINFGSWLENVRVINNSFHLSMLSQAIYGGSATGSAVIENNTFNDIGDTSYYDQFLISFSPLSYDGNNFSQYVYMWNSELSNIPITADDTDVSSFVTGNNNFRLWLIDLPAAGFPFATFYMEEPPPFSCAAAAASYGGTCYLDEPDYFVGNGNYEDYTANADSAAEVIEGYTAPPYLRYNNASSYDSPAIFFDDAAELNISGNIFNSSSNYLPILSYVASSVPNIWQNHFYDVVPINYTETNYCINQEGNFYIETISQIPTADCGQANITIPADDEEKNNTFNITWAKQSSIFNVFYDLFIKKIGQAFTFLGATNDTNYTFDTTSYNDTNYALKIIPYVNGSRINATNAYRNFSINNIPQIPVPVSPASEAVLTSRTPAFIWNASSNEEGAVYYNLLADNDSDFSSPEINATTTNTSYAPASDLYFDDYFWKVNANDTIYVSNFSEIRNFTIIKNIACILPSDTVNFGQISLHETKNTTGNIPITVENSGNLQLNISINATSLWQNFPSPTRYYQYRIGPNGSGAFEWALNDSWYNISNETIVSIAGLKYYDSNDTARIDIQVEAPEGEGAGNKSSIISVWCEQDE